MKKLLLILLCLPLLFSCGRKKKDNDLGNLKGKVKSVIRMHFAAKEVFGDFEKGDLDYKYEYKYDKDGNITETSSYDKDGKLRLYSSNKYKYDKDGNMTEEASCNKDGELRNKTKYKYDEEGNLTEEDLYNKDGELRNKTKYKYDEDGNLIEDIHYTKDGKLWYKTKYKYDKDSNLTESNQYNKVGDLEYKNEYKYDIENRKISESFYAIENGNLGIITKYDKDGNQIEEMNHNGDGMSVTKYKYDEFDENNNWIVRMEIWTPSAKTSRLVGGIKLIKIHTREIKYY